jgi:predicted transcriptional regulator
MEPARMEIRLTDRESDVMDVLWRRGPSTVAEVRESLADDLAYTTVLTILRTLEDKGYVTHEQEGRAHRYAALVERDLAQRSALRALTRKLFQGSTGLVLAHLVEDENLSEEEIERIKRLLRRRSGSRKEKPR